MNKLYMVKRNALGQSVVCSEKTRSCGKMKTLVATVATVTALIGSAAHAGTVGILGYPTGANAVAVGQDSWATSVSGAAVGHDSIATGIDITRAEFDALSEKHKNALDSYKKAQDAVTFAGNDIDANRNAIDGLNREIADLAEKQKAAASKIAERDKLNNQKNPLTNQLGIKQDELTKATEALKSVQDSQGRNLFLDFTNVLNSLDWTPLNKGGNSSANRDIVATELKKVVEANHPEFATKYDQAKYRDIVDGYINRQASYQGSVEGISANLTNFSGAGNGSSGSIQNVLNVLYFQLPKQEAGYVIETNKVLDSPDYLDAIANAHSTRSYSADKTFSIETNKGKIRGGALSLTTSAGGSLSRYLNDAGTASKLDSLNFLQRYYNSIVLSNTLKGNDYSNYASKSKKNLPSLGGDTKDSDFLAFAKKYNALSMLKNGYVDNLFAIKTNSGAYIPYYVNELPIHNVLTKIADYSVNNNNLISSVDINDFKESHSELKNLIDNTDWSDPNAAYDLKDYRTQLDKAYAYSNKVNNLLNLYQEVIDEAKKPNANKNTIDQKTAQILALKKDIVGGMYDISNYSVGIVPKLSAKGQEYIDAVKPQYDALIGRINSELKLYNDQDSLIVEATTKSKDLQAKYDAAKKAVDDLKKQIADIDAQIAKIGLTPDEAASADLKAQKEKELADAQAKKAELEKALADKTKAAEEARNALDKTGMKDRGNRNLAAGYDAFASGDDSIAIGTNATAIKQNAIAIGKNNMAAGVNTVAIGSDNTVTGNNSTVIGAKNNVAGANMVVLGNNVTVTADYFNSVVLGNDSTVGKATPTANTTIRGKTYEFAGKTPTGVVSVGATGKERQITNVAAGRISATSTDAVNGSQLYAVTDALNTLKVEAGGMNINAEKGSITPNAKQVTLKGDGKNISTTANGTNITVSLSDDPTFNSVKVGDVTINQTGINAGGKKVTNVADGAVAEGSKDAVNGGQLHNVTKQVANNTKAIKDLGDDLTKTKLSIVQNTKDIEDLKPKVAKNTADIATNKANIAANKAEIDNLKPKVAKNTADIAANKAEIAKGLNFKTQDGVVTNKKLGDTLTINGDGKNITTKTNNGAVIVTMSDDIKVNTVTLSKDGEVSATSKQAVNGSQLYQTNMNVTNNTKAINVVKATVDKGINTTTDDGKTINYKLGDSIKVAGDGVNTATKTIDGKTVVGLNRNINIDSAKVGNVVINQNGVIDGVADGEISASSRQAINGSQLNTAYNYFNENLNYIKRHVDDVENNLEAAIAGTNAAAALPQVRKDGKSMLAFAMGAFEDKGALAVGYSRASDNGRTLFKAHLNANTESKFGGGVGIGFEW